MPNTDSLVGDNAEADAAEPDSSGMERNFRAHVTEAEHGPGSSGYRRDLAHWRETLRQAPAAAHVAGRRRALAPAGMGCNRGEMGFVTARLEDLQPPAGASLSDCLMAAWARALADSFGLDALVIDRWFSERGTSQPADLLGPLDSSYPVVIAAIGLEDADVLAQVQRADSLGHAHRVVDTPRLESEMGDWLRTRGIALRQFGFAFIDADQAGIFGQLDTPLDAVPQALHELQLAAALTGEGLDLRLAADLEVVTTEEAQVLFDRVLAELADMLGLCAAPEPADRRWSGRRWSESWDIIAKLDKPSELAGIANVEREIPITSSQLGMLRFVCRPDATRYAKVGPVIGKEFIVRPQMGLERLDHVTKTMVARHDAMRTRFVKHNGVWRAYLEREPSQMLRVEEVADEASAMARASELADELIEVTDPMFRITVIRFGSDGDLIVAKAHHLVMDGYTLGLIVEEVVKAYLGLPLPPVEMDVDRFFQEFDHAGQPGSLERREAFLQGLFADPPPIPNIGRKAKGLQSNLTSADCGSGRSIVFGLPAELHEEVSRRAKAAGTTESALVAAAYADTLASMGGVEDVFISVTYARRTSRRLNNFAYFVASPLPVRVRPASHSTLEDIALAIGSGTEAAIPFAPYFDAYYGSAFQEEIISKGSYISLFQSGEVTASTFSRDSVSSPLQRLDAAGEIDMGAMRVTILPDMRRDPPLMQELSLQTFKSEGGIGILLKYDVRGYEREEAQQFLDKVITRLGEE